MSLKLSKTVVVAAVVGVVAGVVDAGNGCCAGAGSRSVNCPGLVITAPTLTADRGHCSLPPTFLYRSGVMGVFIGNAEFCFKQYTIILSTVVFIVSTLHLSVQFTSKVQIERVDWSVVVNIMMLQRWTR